MFDYYGKIPFCLSEMTDIAVTMAIKSKIDLIILNAIALLFYLFVFYQLRIPFEESFMFSTPDAKSYWRVAQWLEVGLESSSVSMRPFLYPLIISVASYFGGFIYLWVIQFVFWILSINLLYRTLQKITQNVILIWIGVGI